MLTANLAVAGALCGLIWTIQRVHYPLFALVEERSWTAYMAQHGTRITPVVAPLMIANVAIAAVLVADDPAPLRIVNAACAAGAFVSTGVVFAPLHGRLGPQDVKRLVTLNWLRTALWTAQLGVACALAG